MSGLLFLDYSFKLHPRGGHEVSYQAARFDNSGDPQYNGWIADDGSYIFSEHNISAGTIKYFSRRTNLDLDTDWTNRVSLTYVEYNELFS